MANVEKLVNIAITFMNKKYNDIAEFLYTNDIEFNKKVDVYILNAFVTRKEYNPMISYTFKIKNDSVIDYHADGKWEDYFKSSKMFDMDNSSSEKLKYFDFVLTKFDNITENILTKMRQWKKHYEKKNEDVFRLLLDIEFKVNETYFLFIELINAIYDLTFIYYRTYYGPFKEKNVKETPFTKSVIGSEAITKITYLLDSFFVQYISLLDYVTKLVCQSENRPHLKNIDSYPNLFKVRRNNLSQEEKDVLNSFLLYSEEMNEIRYYRNAMIHQKCIPKFHHTKRIDSFILSDLVIATIRKKKGPKKKKSRQELEFDIGKDGSPNSGYSIIHYSTYAFFKLLSTLDIVLSI